MALQGKSTKTRRHRLDPCNDYGNRGHPDQLPRQRHRRPTSRECDQHSTLTYHNPCFQEGSELAVQKKAGGASRMCSACSCPFARSPSGRKSPVQPVSTRLGSFTQNQLWHGSPAPFAPLSTTQISPANLFSHRFASSRGGVPTIENALG